MTMAACHGKKTVALCFRQRDEGVTAQLANSLQTEFLNKGYRVITDYAANDQFRQNQQITTLLEDCDLLVVESVMISAAEGILEQAKKLDVPVVFINYVPETSVLETWDKTCYIGSDMSQPGLLQSQLVQQLPDHGDVDGDGTVAYTVISGPEDHLDAVRWTTDCIISQSGNQLAQSFGDWSRESGREICRQQLEKFGEKVEVILCNHDNLAMGALEALEDKKLDAHVIGIGGNREALRLIQQGRMRGTIAPDIFRLTECVTKAAEALLSGNQPDKIQILDFLIITKENVDVY